MNFILFGMEVAILLRVEGQWRLCMDNNLKKMVMALMIGLAALLITSCGSDRNGEPALYGYQGDPCGNLTGNFNGFNSFSSSGYPNMGQFLQANPSSVFRYGNSCYTGTQLYQMYNQNGTPWNQFASSPYGAFQMYNPYGQASGSSSYNSSNSMSYNNSWVGAGDFFGGFPFMRYPRNQWSLNFHYWDNR